VGRTSLVIGLIAKPKTCDETSRRYGQRVCRAPRVLRGAALRLRLVLHLAARDVRDKRVRLASPSWVRRVPHACAGVRA